MGEPHRLQTQHFKTSITMSYSLNSIVLIITVVLTGLSAGLCFTWGNAITPGIAKLSNLQYLSAFQAMNRSIINPTFIVVFFGPIIIQIWSAIQASGQSNQQFWLIAVAAAIYFVGLILVTIFGNVPLNELLEATQLDTASTNQLKTLRTQFEARWNLYHTIRTLSTLIAFILLTIGLLIQGKSI